MRLYAGLTGLVTRPRELVVEYHDRAANLHSLHLQGFSAVVLQHEVDHLDGVLFIDRSDIRDLAFWDVFLRRLQDGEIQIATELDDEEQ
jgi:peptide deformylase